MNVTRIGEAKKYEAKRHFEMVGLHLQGGSVSKTDGVTISLSYFLPGGGAERSASATDKYYILLEGELVIKTDAAEEILGPMDSCHLSRNESRSILNRQNTVAKMLVVVIA